MTLIYTATGETWRGERIGGVAHPRNIEQLWTAEQLAALGLEVAPAPEPAPAPSLPDVISSLNHRIDSDAENIRLKYITPGDGMGMTYREKFEQAELVNEIGETSANALSSEERIAAYPTLAASVGLEAATLWECAQLVRSNYAQFAQLSNKIEKTRLSGKASVSAATTPAEAQAAYEAIQWTV